MLNLLRKTQGDMSLEILKVPSISAYSEYVGEYNSCGNKDPYLYYGQGRKNEAEMNKKLVAIPEIDVGKTGQRNK